MAGRHAGIVAVALAALVAVGGCGSSQRSPTELVAHAKDLQDRGELRTAVIELKNAVQADPRNAEARWLLGNIYVDLGQGEAAEKELLRARELGVSAEAVRLPLGQALLLQGRHEDVLREVPPVMNASGAQAARSQVIRAEALLGLGKAEQACGDLEQARQSDPSYIPAYWHLARCAVARKDLEQAQVLLNQALERDRENFRTWDYLGDLGRLRADWTGAAKAFEAALEIRPDAARTRLRLAAVHLAEQRLGEARKQIERALELNARDPMGHYMQGVLAFREGDLQASRESLQQVLAVVPNHPQTQLLFGVVNHRLGYYEQAVTHLSQVLNRYPNNDYARKLLAAGLIRTDLPDKAAEVIAPLFRAGKQDPQLLALQSEIHMRRGEHAKAAEYLEQAAELDPDNAMAHLNLGMGLLRAGDTERALAELRTASRLGADSHRADFLVILAHLGREEYEEALQAIEALEEELPGSGALYNLKAGVYLGQGEIPTARKYLEKAMAAETPSVGAAMNLAQLDLNDGKVAAARQRYETVLSWDSTNLNAMLGLARLAARQGEDAEFKRWVDLALETHPAALAPRELLAHAHLARGEADRALQLAREAYDQDPKNPDAVALLGEVQLAMGEAPTAAGTFRELIELRPDSPAGFYGLGKAHQAAGNRSAAAEAYQRALGLQPENLDARAALATLRLEQQQYAEALRLAQQIQDGHPRSAVGHILEGDARLQQRDIAAAAQSYERALRLEASAPAVVGLHRSLLAQGRVEEGVERLRQWLERHGDDYTVRSTLAQTYLLGGKKAQALEQYEGVLALRPDDVRALNNLAWLYHFEKDDRALATARKAHALAPDNPAIQDTYGWLLVQAGDVRRGVELLRQAAQEAPQTAEVHFHYAAGLAKLGQSEQAQRQLEALLSPETEEQAWTADARALLDELRRQ